MLKGYVSTEEVGRLLRGWVELYGMPATAELSVRFRIKAGEKDLQTVFAGSLGSDPWPDASASAYTLEAVDAAIRPEIIKERDHHRAKLADLEREAAAFGFQLVPVEKAAAPRVLKLSGPEPDDSMHYDSN